MPFSSPMRTSKHPFRGRPMSSGLMVTFTEGSAASVNFFTFPARVLNAPHDLQASTMTDLPVDATFFAGLASFFAAFFVAGALAEPALRFVEGILPVFEK